MGADRAILVKTDAILEPLTAARAFLAVIGKENPDLVIVGKQAIDDDAAQTGPMIAALWDRPQATFASKVEIKGGTALVTREVDAGLETIEVDLPAVISADLRLNEPRYVKLPDIMKAKKKPLDVVELASLGVAAEGGLRCVLVEPPKPRAKQTERARRWKGGRFTGHGRPRDNDPCSRRDRSRRGFHVQQIEAVFLHGHEAGRTDDGAVARARKVDRQLLDDASRSARHHVDVVGQKDRFLYIVGHEDNGAAEVIEQLQQPFLHLRLRLRVERAEGFVEQHDVHVDQQGAQQGRALAHAAR